jgi:YVTN family beta-propeller protein
VKQIIAAAASLAMALAAPVSAQVDHSQHAASGMPSVAVTARTGPGVYELGTDARGLLYVAHAGTRAAPGGGITVYDARTLEVKNRYAMPEAAPNGVGVNSRTGLIYTTNTRASNVSVVDAATGKLVAAIADPTDPGAHLFRVLIDEETNTVYTSVTGGRIWVIDGHTNTIRRIIENVGETTIGLALDRGGNRLYAVNMGHNQLVEIDLDTDRVVRRINTEGQRSTIAAFDPATRRLFVTNQGSGDLSVISADSAKLVRLIPTGAGALGVSFSAKSNRLYVTNRQAGTVSVIDAASLEKVADLPVAGFPNTVTVASDGSVFVTAKLRTVEGAEPVGDTVSRLVP